VNRSRRPSAIPLVERSMETVGIEPTRYCGDRYGPVGRHG
jgi:hypothetical protein